MLRSSQALAAHGRSSLALLDASFCHGISNAGLGYLCERAGPRFKKLKVWGMNRLTDEGFYLCHGR